MAYDFPTTYQWNDVVKMTDMYEDHHLVNWDVIYEDGQRLSQCRKHKCHHPQHVINNTTNKKVLITDTNKVLLTANGAALELS